MGIFSSIKNAIFGKAEAATPAEAPKPAVAPPAATAAPAAAPAAMDEIDVEARLSAMAGADNLNWRSSIVDLLKLLGIDASYDNRKALATELGDTNYSGSAEDNIALHKAVMKELAANGGKVPADLLD
jgi:3-oxoacyl-ACP reductase-like protein